MNPQLHTVAVTIPGTQTRLLVDRLLGTPDEARRLAVQTLAEIYRSRIPIAVTVIRTDDVTDVSITTETP